MSFYIKRFWKHFISKIYNWNSISVVFVIGTGRTGTEFFAKLCDQLFADKTESVHEPFPDLLKISVEARKGKWSPSEISNEIRYSRLNRLRSLKKNDKCFYIESNNNISFLLPYLKRVFPNLKLLYFVRDPESFLISEMNKRHGNKKFLIFGDDDHRERISPKVLEDKFQDNWESWDRARKIIWYWKSCNDYILSYINQYESMIVKYEDFFKDINCVRKTLIFAGLDISGISDDQLQSLLSRKLNSSKDMKYVSLNDFDDEFRNFFIQMTNSLKEKFNY